MPTHRIRRGTALLPGESGKADSSPLYVKSTTSEIQFVPGTGTTELTLVDKTSAQTLSGKTLTSPTINTPVFGTPAAPVVITGDGAITIANSFVVLTKGSAAAITLAAPSAGQAGTRITVSAGSSWAHVITATSLVEDGVTGIPHTTCTFGAFIGATITFIAYNLLWHVESKNVVTIT